MIALSVTRDITCGFGRCSLAGDGIRADRADSNLSWDESEDQSSRWTQQCDTGFSQGQGYHARKFGERKLARFGRK